MTSEKPDILFIVLDTQRADRIGCYGNQRNLTPNLDAFAEKGALFEQAVAPAQWTIPSHASMFTGLYPTAHQVTQSNQSLSKERLQLVELMSAAGYETVGFVNNPLLGILDNGMKRGFDTFYLYGGAAPNVYREGSRLPVVLQKIGSFIGRKFRQFADPIQRIFGNNDLALRLSLNQWVTPIWSRFLNFKGQNERSIRHLLQFLKQRDSTQTTKPLFLFLNLMETHLPFWPPNEFIDQTAPYLRQDGTASAEMRRWNREAYRWAAPLDQPLSQLESRMLSDLYDAEVAYQDSYLGPLLNLIEQRGKQKNTLTIIVADHGDGLGEHDCVGHAFVAYDELVHVPLIVHWPEKINDGMRIEAPASTRRVFHTMLEAAGISVRSEDDKNLSLLETIHGNDPEDETAYAEVYPPLNFMPSLEHRQPHLIEKFRCKSLRRAVVSNGYKLIHVDDKADELFDLDEDPLEINDILQDELVSHTVKALDDDMTLFRESAENQRAGLSAGDTFEVQDEEILQQLRGLGYIE